MYGLHRSRRGKVLAAVALAGASALVLAGCGGGTSSGTENTGSSSESTGNTNAGGDLTLKMGSLVPSTASLAFLGPPQQSGFDLAVKEVNDAAAGITIDAFRADEGDSNSKTYETSITTLRNDGVTAIMGAASSGVSKIILPGNVSAGILQISPSNTSPDFTTIDDDGLYFRTAPSDLLQGEVLANLIAGDNKKSLAIVYQNDAYGQGLDKAIKENFEASGGKVVAEESFNVGDGTFDAQVAAVKAANPDAVAVVSFDQFKTLGPQLVNAGITADKFYMVDGNLSQYGKDFPVSLEGAQGTKAGPKLADDFTKRLNELWTSEGNAEIKDYTYAAEAYDAVTLVALAALAAGSVEGKDIAAKMQEVSGGSGKGEACTSFKECADILKSGKTPDYNGVSGDVTFDENGDPQGAAIGTYKYGADNNYTRTD